MAKTSSGAELLKTKGPQFQSAVHPVKRELSSSFRMNLKKPKAEETSVHVVGPISAALDASPDLSRWHDATAQLYYAQEIINGK